jgi:glycosyltransferase involved in cell wall biosynthesis
MRIAFIHQNLPGQYRGILTPILDNPENEVVGIGDAAHVRHTFLKVHPRLKLLGYNMPQLTQPIAGHPFLSSTEEAVIRGEVVGRVLADIKEKGFKPDVICCHSGWGESFYIKDVYPDACLINYCEFFYQVKGRDHGFDPEYPEGPFSEWNLRTRNAIQLLALPSMDAGLSPTHWQQTSYPEEYRPKISVIHDGVDTDSVRPDPEAFVYIREKDTKLTVKDEVITFVNRNLEPYRGFHVFMRALPDLLKERPKAHVLIIGGDSVSYGKKLSMGTYRQRALQEVGDKIDHSRVHFLGQIPYMDYMRVLQISTAHVYLTYPFVLSWSMMEAMAAGCLVIGSKTAPVEEVIRHEENGLLVDFFSPQEMVAAINRVCEHKDRMQDIRNAARKTIVDRYDFKNICVPQHISMMEKASGVSLPVTFRPGPPF